MKILNNPLLIQNLWAWMHFGMKVPKYGMECRIISKALIIWMSFNGRSANGLDHHVAVKTVFYVACRSFYCYTVDMFFSSIFGAYELKRSYVPLSPSYIFACSCLNAGLVFIFIAHIMINVSSFSSHCTFSFLSYLVYRTSCLIAREANVHCL